MAVAASGVGEGRFSAFDSIAASQTGSAFVAAQAGSKIRVTAVVINQGDTTPSTVTFLSASTAKTPALKGPANGGFVLPFNESGWFETAEGEALNVTTGAGSTTGIIVNYEVIKVVK
jgi:hypothetical protein